MDLKKRLFFYEVEFMENHEFHYNSKHHHQQIISDIENEQIKEAVEIIKINWLQTLDFIKL